MLELKKIHKYYRGKDIEEVHALKGIDMTFRDCEFVSILGQSGCGKTTLLNIIGGLDKYDEGDLIINGVSTKEYKNHDWDIYRNNTIGFVFQSYNLIPHLTVLANVELSLTLSGVSKKERKERAIEALERVGLKEHINKKPNQLSGGQMQRVAIARAIVNKPSIVLADEPTGALDTQTSIQVMDILKDIAKTCLVIMVTHNPDLAEQYSTRIIRLLDGEKISDTKDVEKKEVEAKYKELEVNPAPRNKKVKMKFKTSLGLSLRNLMTKKGRTILTAFAGSIGIIGIALILSVSSGFNNYISDIEEDTLSTYPLQINRITADLTSFNEIFKDKDVSERDPQTVYSNNVLTNLLEASAGAIKQNDMASFKNYIQDNYDEISPYITDIKYSYDLDVNIYGSDYETRTGGPQHLNPFSFAESLPPAMQAQFQDMSMLIDSVQPWQEMLDNKDFVKSQYDLVAGLWPENDDEVVLVVDENNEIYDYYLYALGVRDPNEILEIIAAEKYGIPYEKVETELKFSDILNMKFRVLPKCYMYGENEGVYVDMSKDTEFMKTQLKEKGFDIKITGIIRPIPGQVAASINGCVGYSSSLVKKLANIAEESPIVQQQVNNKDINVLTGEAFETGLDWESNKLLFGCIDENNPSTISIYPSSFEGKDKIIDFIEKYNDGRSDEDELKYSDLVGVLMSSISTIINAITYVLIAFVSISLVVSSIMISIVTHISVIERTKEIGVLRSIGASKQDVRNVFNAETLFIGFASGLLGVLVTVLLCIPINIILDSLANLHNLAKLPWQGAIALILISTLLTIIAGLIPANKAAKLDPVNALRSE